MKIIQVITRGYLFYGAQKHVLDLSRSLVEDGHDVLVLCGSAGPLTERLAAAGVEFRIVPSLQNPIRPFRDLAALWNVYREIRKFAPDVVATHSGKAGIVGRAAAIVARVPRVFTAHGWSFAEGIPESQYKLALKLERFFGRRSDRVIAVANSEREYGLQHGVTGPEKLVTVYYGVDDMAGGPIERSGHVPPVRLVMVAGFREQKDHATLFHALSTLGDLSWTLTLLDDGELEDEMRSLCSHLSLDERVTFAGAVGDVSPYLRDADLLVLITRWEGMPISTIEGLAFGLPVIASDVAGTREQVIDGWNGLLVGRESREGVADALRRLISDSSLRDEFGRNSRSLYEDEFTVDKMYRKTLAVYEDAVCERR